MICNLCARKGRGPSRRRAALASSDAHEASRDHPPTVHPALDCRGAIRAGRSPATAALSRGRRSQCRTAGSSWATSLPWRSARALVASSEVRRRRSAQRWHLAMCPAEHRLRQTAECRYRCIVLRHFGAHGVRGLSRSDCRCKSGKAGPHCPNRVMFVWGGELMG